jgi:chromosome segregation ATPase
MDDPAIPVQLDDPRADEFAQVLGAQRDRVRSFFTAQAERLQRAQAELALHVQRLAERLEEERGAVGQERRDLDDRAGELARQAEGLTRLKEELAARQAEWEQLQDRAIRQQRDLAEEIRRQQDELSQRQESLEARRKEIDAAEAQLQQSRQAWTLACEGHKAEADHVAALRARLERELAELDAQRAQLAAAQAETETKRRRIAEQFKAQRAAHLKEIERRRAELERLDSSHLGELQQQVEDLGARLQRQSTELEQARQRETQLVGASEAARQRETELSLQLEVARQRNAELVAKLNEAEGRLGEHERELTAARQQGDGLEGALQGLRATHGQLSAELEQASQRERDLAARLEAARAQEAQLTEALAAAGAREAALESQSEAARQRGLELSAQLDAAHGCHAEMAAELAEARERLAGIEALAEESKKRGAEMARRIAELETELARTPRPGDAADSDDCRRRLELALEDVRELKARNESLEEQLRRAPAGPTQPEASGGTPLDWESEKRRILASLESECPEGQDGGTDQATRLEIESIVRATDQAIGEKEREIAELKQLLENQSARLGDVAVGAAALGQVLDNDALIREERENLRRLQAECEEKLRKGEIEISLERAKIARERAQLEEQRRAIGEPTEHSQATSDQAGKTGKPAKPARGRWLSRLGLKDPPAE